MSKTSTTFFSRFEGTRKEKTQIFRTLETAIEKCTWTSPSGFSFEAHTTRAHTTQPDGIKIISSDENICKIQIGHLSEAQLGKWTCQIKLEGTVFFPF